MVEYIENKYNIKVDDFIELYKYGYSREKLAKELNTTEFVVRTIANLLGLRLKRKYRDTDYATYKKSNSKEYDATLTEALKELKKRNKQLQNCRDKSTLLRKELRLGYRIENIYESITNDIKNMDCVVNNKCEINTIEPISNTNGVTIICLSDLHVGAFVDKNDVINNEYNFDIMVNRLNKVFEEALIDNNTSNNIKIVILGDIFDGVIHNSHLIAEMPVVKAITKFVNILSSIINEIDRNVELYVVTGNHDRITDEQQIYKKGFDFTYLFVELLKSFSNIPINYFITGHGIFEIINNEFAYMFHGDTDRTYKSYLDSSLNKAVKNCLTMFNIEPKLILSGHTHKYNKTILHNKGYAITVGSLIGTNNYSFNKIAVDGVASQTILFYNYKAELISEKVIQF